jgi:ATP-dependent helicase HepA
VFVQARGSEGAALGIGKLVDRTEGRCTVGYFDAPTSEPVIRQFESNLIQAVLLPEQTRVYHFDEAVGAWEVGRILGDHGDSQLIQFPNGATKHLKASHVFVRWAREIVDPTPFLASKINESPRFSDGRSAFIRSQMNQRAASMGMSALLASAVELEAHQIEVVRRILQDPVQRYLLADEVGLGKTIEAGILIRQCVLDAVDDFTILVIVPEPLIAQWRSELSSKFFLNHCLDKSIHVLALGDIDRIGPLLDRATMLVIDEAHHLTESRSTLDGSVYSKIAAAAPEIERVLLLSATPALHNERGFLEMLHLLDPKAYPLDGEATFRRKIEGRQALAEIVAGLTPQNVLYLDYTINQLAELFSDDALLQEHALSLRAVIDTMPGEDEPALIEAIGKIHAHLSEVYRLHRRILRNRRRSIGGLTPDRAGAQVIEYSSPDMAAVTSAIDNWRFAEAMACGGEQAGDAWTDSARAFWQALDCASQYSNASSGIASFLTRQSAFVGDSDDFDRIAKLLARPGLFDDRVEALVSALPRLLSSKAQIVIFCSDPKTADTLAETLAGRLKIVVDRHGPDNDNWMRFNDDPGHAILVCDRRAEEGLNLQGGKKIVVHYDVPFNPNRMEQRLGRTDRYGSGDAVLSVVLQCRDDPLANSWFDYLNTCLKLFDRSIASLQYLLNETTRGLAASLFSDGAEALADLISHSVGEQGLIEREVRAIDQQDALDSLGSPPTDLLDNISDVDDDWRSIAADTAIWIEKTLQFTRTEERLERDSDDAAPFRYRYSTSNRHTLIPLATYVAHCRPAIDLNSRPHHGRVIHTIPYSFRRRTALARRARNAGVGLLRYGDPFISGMTDITQTDDRGRSFAMWRYTPDYEADRIADVFVRFDFVLEVDVEPALQILKENERLGPASVAAIRRRGDMALPPFFKTVWLTHELMPVENPRHIELLARRYAPDARDAGGRDFNLNARRWQRVARLNIPELEYWADFCGTARVRAEETLRVEGDLAKKLAQADRRASSIDHGRLGQLRARARNDNPESAAEEHDLLLEERLSAALRHGIRSPHIRVDAIGAIFLSGNREAAQIMGREA